MTGKILTQSYLKECLSYDPYTGELTWKDRPTWHSKSFRAFKIWKALYANKKAGSKTDKGYLVVSLDGRRYKSHRLIWLWMTGAWPEDQLDHIDHDRLNNKWDNLREISGIDNCRNASISGRNTSGFVGVSWYKGLGKWVAKIHIDGENNSLGTFSEIEDAIAARKAANIEYGFHPNHGQL